MFTKHALETQMIIMTLQKCRNWLWNPPGTQWIGQWVPGSFPGVKRMVVGVMLNTHLHLAPKLRMIGGIQILPIYVFIAWAWITSPFYLYLLFGSLILLTDVIVKQGIFWRKKRFLTPAANRVNCRVVLLSHKILFP